MLIGSWQSYENGSGLDKEETSRLATYNSEVHRGLVHTPEWVSQMQALQRRFDEGNEHWARVHGGEPMLDGGGGWIYSNGLIKCGDRACRCRKM